MGYRLHRKKSDKTNLSEACHQKRPYLMSILSPLSCSQHCGNTFPTANVIWLCSFETVVSPLDSVGSSVEGFDFGFYPLLIYVFFL